MAGYTAVALFTSTVLACSVDFSGGVHIYTYQGKEIFLQSYLNQRYILLVNDVESFGAILTRLGVDETLKKVWLEEKPIVDLTFDGKMYTFHKYYGSRSLKHRFALGRVVQGTTLTGKMKRRIFHKVGKDTLGETIQIGDKTLVLMWKFGEDELTLTMEMDNIVAKGTFTPFNIVI